MESTEIELNQTSSSDRTRGVRMGEIGRDQRHLIGQTSHYFWNARSCRAAVDPRRDMKICITFKKSQESPQSLSLRLQTSASTTHDALLGGNRTAKSSFRTVLGR